MADRTKFYGAPLIVPSNYSVTAKAGEPFQISCHASSNITWVFIDPHSENIDSSGLDVRYNLNESSLLFYEAILEFSAPTVYDVKYYYCIKEQSLILAENGADLKNEEHNFHATSIYMFVEDPDAPLVPVINPIISVKQYEPFTIPCKPAHPNVEVELIKTDNDEVSWSELNCKGSL